MKTKADNLPRALIVSTVALNALGIGLVIPVMPQLLQQIGGVDISRAASIGGMLSLAFVAMQVLFGPLMGALSDQFGRRPVIVISLLTSAIDYAVLSFSNLLLLFFLARLVSGIASATYSVANATMADTVPPEKRAAQFGLTGAALGIGFVLGPVFGGLLGEIGPRAPFVAAACLCFSAATLCYFFLPETLAKESRRKLQFHDCIPLRPLWALRRQPRIRTLALVNFFDGLAGTVFPAVWSYYCLAQFDWQPGMVGVSLAAYGICMAGIQGGLIRVLVPRWGEHRTALVGLVFGVIGFLVLCRLESGTLTLMLIPILTLRVLSSTAVSGLVSKQASGDEQGELQGILTGVNGVAQLISLPLMTQVFEFANHPGAATPWPGAPFAVAAGFTAMALVILAMRKASQE